MKQPKIKIVLYALGGLLLVLAMGMLESGRIEQLGM